MYAGFWKRFAAVIIDSIIVYGIIFVLMTMLGYGEMTGGIKAAIINIALLNLLSFVIYVLYWSLFESSRLQATPGKMALGIKVTDINGGRVSFGRALGRNLGKIISGLTLNIGYVMAGFTVRKQALHDKMADCLVMDKNFSPQDLRPLEPAKGWLIFLAVLGALTPFILMFLIWISTFMLFLNMFDMPAMNLDEDSAPASFSVYEVNITDNMLALAVMFQDFYANDHEGKYAESFEELANEVPGFPLQSFENSSYTFVLGENYIAASSSAQEDTPAYTLTRCYSEAKSCIYSEDKAFSEKTALPFAQPESCCL